MQAREVDPGTLDSNSKVSVIHSSYAIIFTPVADSNTSALIFYPGALVEPEAYAPMAHKVAVSGFKTIIVKLPYRLAPLKSHKDNLARRTLDYINTEKERSWVVGGHSLGGKLAAQFANSHSNILDGLILIGTSHPRELDLSGLNLDVTKIYGSEDGLASEEEVEIFAKNLPSHTYWIKIKGANHRQFGWYGYQLGDGTALISRAEQQRITTSAITDLLKKLQLE